MKSPLLLPSLAIAFILSGFVGGQAGETGTDAPAKKPVARRATVEPLATPATPVMRRDSRKPAPGYIDVRIARIRPAAPWTPGAPGD